MGKTGYNVYLPEIISTPYAGQMDMNLIGAWVKEQKFNIMQERYTGLEAHLKSKGYKNLFLIGFCYGVWVTFKLAVDSQHITSIGGMHPSLMAQQMIGGETSKLTSGIRCPAYLFPAGNDPANIKPEGEVLNILKGKFGTQKIGSHEFPDMLHGWTIRGDLNDDKVKRDVQEVIKLCDQYFKKFQ